ncbi:MAG: DUF512 domain-containing protein [Anaerolineae bacterium]|nr:DUF512 domain-containing protein [Anaerolineae bacterium]
MAQDTEHMTPVGEIVGVEPGSLAAALGVQPGDLLLEVNGAVCEDVIDVHYWASDEQVALTVLRNGAEVALAGARAYDQPLGLAFAHPTFDTDIRRCNNLCEFCFVLQMAPKMRRTLYIKDDDYRYSFLHGHFVTLTNLSAHDWARIVEQGLSPLYVSVHATALEVRRQCLRNPDAPDVMAQLRWLGAHGIETHTQIVVTPGLNDGPHLERSVRDLATLWPAVRSVSVVPVGLTQHHKYGHRINTLAECHAVLDACAAWQETYRKALGVRFVYPTDEWYLRTGRPIPPAAHYDGLALQENGLGMVRDFLDEWAVIQRKEVPALKPAVSSVTLATATLFAPTLARAAAALAEATGVRIEVVSVVNRRLGETITVAGLLMGEEVIADLKARDLGEVVVLPRVLFDHPEGVSLDDVTPAQVAEAVDRPVALADSMGDVVDVLAGRKS